MDKALKILSWWRTLITASSLANDITLFFKKVAHTIYTNYSLRNLLLWSLYVNNVCWRYRMLKFHRLWLSGGCDWSLCGLLSFAWRIIIQNLLITRTGTISLVCTCKHRLQYNLVIRAFKLVKCYLFNVCFLPCFGIRLFFWLVIRCGGNL